MSHTISLRPVLAGGRNVAFELAVKRVMDICVSAFLLVALSPMLLIVALMVRLTSPGSVFHTCDWIGHEGRPFRGWKFRTMIPNADSMEAELRSRNEMTGPAFKITNDPRVTPVGRILRRYSIDELPQLWNVLKGDISLVGPRAPREHEYAQFTDFQKQKLAVKPGITCLWQVQGRHRISDYDRWVELDLEYIATWSLWLDIRILARTALVVVQGTGV
ncbi:MAG: UDP-phosphate galactose phosphotransferase [Alphaproteobacteria bacterium PA2]|nr:MAG: UDP-phosphate galactose phosphotransferase [Alphaproteobacteria bacterium PA2]